MKVSTKQGYKHRLKIQQGLTEDISLVSLKVFPYKIQVLRVRDDLSRRGEDYLLLQTRWSA